MTDFDARTAQWLSSLKLGRNTDYLTDFSNGYNFGAILEKFNLTRGKKFKDSHDMPCVFQNFKNTRDLLIDNFKVDFPIANIMNRTEELLTVIMGCCVKYAQEKKAEALKQASILGKVHNQSKILPYEQKLLAGREKQIMSLERSNRMFMMPRKIQEIEKKLQKFQQQKTQQELKALESRRKEIENDRSLLQERRLYEIHRLKATHEVVKQQERRVNQIWQKTEQIKHQRMEKEANFNKFMQTKANNAIQAKRIAQERSIAQGLQAFSLNCMRQGIDLEHDPDKPTPKTQDNFNQDIVLERIKYKIKTNEQNRKETVKRENRKFLEGEQTRIKSQAAGKETNLIEQYSTKIQVHLALCKKMGSTLLSLEAERKSIQLRFQGKPPKDLLTINKQAQQQSEQAYRTRKIQYLQEQVQRLTRRKTKHELIAHNILDALLNATVEWEDHFNEQKGFSYSKWKQVQNSFLWYQGTKQKTSVVLKKDLAQYEGQALDYSCMQNEWGEFIETINEKQQASGQGLSQIIISLIDTAEPQADLPPKSDIPLYMPMKVCLTGNTLSGKTTLAHKLSSKYGTMIINPQSVIKQALEACKEPLVEDPKKAKKDQKKVEEDTPEKLALKQFGQLISKEIDSPAKATIKQVIAAIKFVLKLNYRNKNATEIVEQFDESKKVQEERHTKVVKDFQEAAKKIKKDPKKPASGDTEEPPQPKRYFYTKGFILDNFDCSVENIRILERELNGYMADSERVNPIAQKYRKKFKQIFSLKKAPVDTTLKQGTFDLLVHLECDGESFETRTTGRKMDPLTQIVYHPQYNPIPTDQKGLPQRLIELEKAKLESSNYIPLANYYSAFGDNKGQLNAFVFLDNRGSLDATVATISSLIERRLDSKYECIQQMRKQNENKNVTANEKISEQAFVPCRNSQFGELFVKRGQNGCRILLRLLDSIYDSYFTRLLAIFRSLQSCRQSFEKQLLTVQVSFVNIVNRPDDKAGKILHFQQSYNKLLSERSNLVRDNEATMQLIARLDDLYNSLWTSLEAKKDEAVAARKNLMLSTWMDLQAQKIVEVARDMLQAELTFLVELLFFELSLTTQQPVTKGKEISLGIPPKNQPILSIDLENDSSSRLEYYIVRAEQYLRQLPRWLQRSISKLRIVLDEQMSKLITSTLEQESTKIRRKISIIRRVSLQRILESCCYYRSLVNKMDDWIIMGVKAENDFVYEIYKGIKKNIQEAKKSTVRDLHAKEITATLKQIFGMSRELVPVPPKSSCAVPILSILTFCTQTKCLVTVGRISFKQFQTYFDRRRQAKHFHTDLLQLDYDIMQQYLVTDETCNYRDLVLAMLLADVVVLEEEALATYQKELEHGQDRKTTITFHEFSLPNMNLQHAAKRAIRSLLFETFREEYQDYMNIQEYIDSLRMFNQLQLYHYGDSIRARET